MSRTILVFTILLDCEPGKNFQVHGSVINPFIGIRLRLCIGSIFAVASTSPAKPV